MPNRFRRMENQRPVLTSSAILDSLSPPHVEKFKHLLGDPNLGSQQIVKICSSPMDSVVVGEAADSELRNALAVDWSHARNTFYEMQRRGIYGILIIEGRGI